jgi:hypothetical protein
MPTIGPLMLGKQSSASAASTSVECRKLPSAITFDCRVGGDLERQRNWKRERPWRLLGRHQLGFGSLNAAFVGMTSKCWLGYLAGDLEIRDCFARSMILGGKA